MSFAHESPVPELPPAGRPVALAERRSFVVAAAVIAIVVIGIVDYATGPRLSMAIFYLIPVTWATARAGRRVGVMLALLSTASAFLSDVVLQSHSREATVELVNVAFMLVTLLLVVGLVHGIHRRAVAAQEAEQRGRDFLAFAAHQLRTPVAGIRSTADALMAGSDGDPKRERLVAQVGTEAARTGRLINSLLRVARLDQHEQMPLRATDLDPLTRTEIDRANRARPSVIWTIDRDSASEIWVMCNPDALAEAIANLLENAGRHARSEVIVTLRTVGALVEVNVRDDGPGIPSGKEYAAFQRFVSMDSHGGSGLGLPIAQGIVEAHDGTLLYERGTFTIRLARLSPPHPATGEAPGSERSESMATDRDGNARAVSRPSAVSARLRRRARRSAPT